MERLSKYDGLSRQELIDRLERVEAENIRLKGGTPDGAGSPDSGAERTFREKYALHILDSLPDMLTVLDRTGKLVALVSSEETNHVGEPGCALIGRDISTMLSPEAYRNIKANLDLVVKSRKGSTANHNITLEGITRHYENRIFPLDEDYSLCMCRDVTDEVKAKSALEQAGQRMASAERIALLSHWYYYEATGELEAPDIIPQLKGTKGSERCSREAFLSHVFEPDREKLAAQLESPGSGDAYVEYRIPLRGKNRFMHSRIIRVYGPAGKRVIEGYAQDMTYVVERLHELEAVKYALNNAEEEIYACSTDGRIEYANDRFIARCKLEGNLSGYRLYELDIPRGNADQWQQLVDRVRENGGSLRYTARHKDPDGKPLVMEVVTYIVYDPVRERDLLWFFARDITQRLEHESKVKELNYVMDAVLNNIPVYLFVKDPGNEFRYLYWNKAFEKYSGIPARVALGHRDDEIFPDPKDAEKFRKDDLGLLHSGQRMEFIERYTAVNGKTRIINTSKALVPLENRLPLIIGVSWDITDLKEAEQELIAAREKAEESDRLKSAFLANMSHEIRTPLNAIVGFSKLIANAETPEEKQQYSDIIDNNSEMLLQLINDILDLSKIEAGTLEFRYETMNLNDLCREQYQIFKDKVRPGVTLVLDDSREQVRFLCDQHRLAQVMTNLIGNAIKFTEAGTIRYGFKVNGKMIDFYVSDTGTGISAEKLPTVFDRFVKLNNFVSGTGLGLAITRMIVERMNGTIRVESEEGKGTTFRFSLPYLNEAGEVPAQAEAGMEPEPGMQNPVPADAGSRKRILIAEDIDSNYLLLKTLLGKQYDITRARNGQEAVDLFQQERFDLILMDIKMPVLDGLEATRIIRKSSTVPVVAVTAFAFDSDREKAKELGCNGFITKPIARAELDRILHEYLG